jgi:hypothetical protein
MKTAVYQINEADGTASLVCVRMPSLHAACALEAWLRMHCAPEKEIRLLGRFDHVHAAIGQQEAEALMMGSLSQQNAGAILSVEELVDRVLGTLRH